MFYQTQTARRPPKGPKNAVFCPWWPWHLTFKRVYARDQTCLPCEFGANPFSRSRDISYTHKKTTDWWRQKRNLSLFTVCGKNIKKVTMQTISSISTMDSYLPPHPLSVTTLPRIMFFNNHIKLQTAKYHIKPSTNSYMHIQLNGHFPIKPMLVRYIPGFLTPLDLELYVISEKKQNFSYTP